jgi:plastocyanin
MRAILAALAVVAGALTTAGPATVEIRTFQFTSAVLEVPVGTEVVWVNRDAIEHTVTSGVPDSADGRFAGRLSASGATFSHTFDRAGTHRYFCNRHRSMRGEIRVAPPAHGES